ncbi:hypothetical protein THAOC_21226, partial [Thalassiosira oceanica]
LDVHSVSLLPMSIGREDRHE